MHHREGVDRLKVRQSKRPESIEGLQHKASIDTELELRLKPVRTIQDLLEVRLWQILDGQSADCLAPVLWRMSAAGGVA